MLSLHMFVACLLSQKQEYKSLSVKQFEVQILVLAAQQKDLKTKL